MARNIRGLSSVLVAVLWATAAVAVLGVGALAYRVYVVGQILGYRWGSQGIFDPAMEELQRQSRQADNLVNSAAGFMLLCSLAFVVLLIVWMWRIAKNAELLGRMRPRWSAGWTIGAWFIPFANFVIPPMVMQDLWRGSDPTVPRGEPGWRRAAGTALIGWWWTAEIIGFTRFSTGRDLGYWDGAFVAMPEESVLRSIRGSDVVAMVGMLAAIAAALLLMSIVRQVTSRQEALCSSEPVILMRAQ